ncbi:MAG: peptidase aminopeptidase [Cyanobacteria bacterium RYN_339]|nr:peptidase aminopeptidase [Cyanobacteria bacterium RYN_339]
MLRLGLILSLLAAPEATTVPWQRLDAGQLQSAGALAHDYMDFLGRAKIPLRRTRYLVEKLKAAGFKPYSAAERWAPGARFYMLNRERALLAVVVGSRPLVEGPRLIGAHLDSPRLDLRIRPLRAAEGLMLLKSEPYGGIKRYQWSNLPLALEGQVAKQDGTLVDVSIGDDPADPVFMLPDLAPHVDKEMRTRTQDLIFKGDELNVVAGALPDEKGDLTKGFLGELHRRYGLVEEDLVSAELSLVPAMAPRTVGLDGSLIGAYGQDDGLCSYLAARSLIDLKGTPTRTCMAYLVDHEEVGNVNATGVRSRFLTNALERFAVREGHPEALHDHVASLLTHAEVLSADVSQAINPNFPGTEDHETTARLGQGFTFKTMKPGYDASPTFRARLRRVMAKHQIPWQTYAYKVDVGGGGTIGASLQELDMDVADVGAPVLAMHGTFELSAKADVYALNRFFGAFYGDP